MENQTDEVASIDNNPDSRSDSTLPKNHLGRRTKPNALKRMTKTLLSSGIVKFILFREDFPKHRVIQNITPLHAILVFYVCLFAALFGLMVLVYATFIGFIAYYAVIAVASLEILHYLYDR